MQPLFWLCVALRIVANPLSNVFQKVLTNRQASPLFVIGITHGLLAILCLPLLAMSPPPLSSAFWTNMAVSTVLAVAGNALIVQALAISDLSFLGPVNAYKSVVSLVPGFILLNEIPSCGSLAGLTLIVAGSYLIVDRDKSASQNVFVRFFRDRGVQYRIGGLVLSAVEAVFLKRALAASSPLTAFTVWSCAGFIVSLVAALVFSKNAVKSQLRILQANRLSCVALATTTGLMQFCTLMILTGFHVAAALALFQTSTLLTVFLGWRVFREPYIARRLVGSAVMVVGAVLIILSR
ncbi:MAG: EamA family transporter [Planctomycetia bacterium]|nr:EamA family transporter [Planctomycetia bacterium]